jgi:hypothetical protein
MKIDFTFDTEYGVFSDAISLPDDHTFTDDEIEAMKQERLTNWINSVKPVEVLKQPSEYATNQYMNSIYHSVEESIE